MQTRLLIVDDAEDHQQLVAALFNRDYQVVQAFNLHDAEKAMDQGPFDLVLLDVTLPDGDGFSFYAKMQSQDHTRNTPVIFVTARSDVPNEVMGFSLGAEDYITKPIEPARLRSRIEARLKRLHDQHQRDLVLHRGDLKVSVSLQRVSVMKGGKENPVDLTPVEFKLLFHLLRHEDHVFTREQLLSTIWGNAAEVFDRTVDMHVSHLRRKITDSHYKIMAVHGTGYRLTKGA